MSRAGETIAGKYRVIAPIGVGGMGTVYAARHLQLETPLALKFLESKSSVDRFLREAKACAALKGEHVCRVSDYGIDGDTPYIAMELLEGEDLACVLRGGKLSVATAVDYVIQACFGLAEAHSLGIVHRDLKPGNLFLTKAPDGSPLIKVLDFGVAKVPVWGDVSLTQTASVIGSPAYMSPEQVRSSRSVDARADVWALGVILYELISDRYPFEGQSLTDLAVAIAMDEPVPLGEAPELQPVISRALEKDPNRRYVDVVSFVEALEPFSHTHAGASEIVSRILYGSVEHATVPRHAEPDAGETVPHRPAIDDAAATTTLQRSTGEVTPSPRAHRRWGVSLGVAAFLVGGGVTAFVLTREPAPIAPAMPAPIAVKSEPAPVPKTGRVIVTVTGTTDAAIYIDGRERGRGVRIAGELSIGAHEIELRVEGRESIRQPVDVQPGMISTVAIVVPAAPTAPPTVTMVAKTAPPRRAPKPAVVADKEQPRVAVPPPAEPPEPALPRCTIHERLPSGKCGTPGGIPVRLLHDDFLAGIRAVWPDVIACKRTEDPGTVRIDLELAIAADGSVTSATVRSADDEPTGTCVASVVRSAKFRPTRNGGSLRYPITL